MTRPHRLVALIAAATLGAHATPGAARPVEKKTENSEREQATTSASQIEALHRAAQAAKAAANRVLELPEYAPDSPQGRAIAIANRWLDAVRHRQVDELVKLSSYPFALRDTHAEIACISCTFTLPRHLRFGIRCLTEDRLLHEELEANVDLLAEIVDPRALPRWARRWGKQRKATQTLVHETLFGNGVTFYLIFLVGPTRVEGLWKHAVFDPN